MKQNVDQGVLQEMFAEVVYRKVAAAPNELGELVLQLTAVVAEQIQTLHEVSEADARAKAIEVAHDLLKRIERKGYGSDTQRS